LETVSFNHYLAHIEKMIQDGTAIPDAFRASLDAAARGGPLLSSRAYEEALDAALTSADADAKRHGYGISVFHDAVRRRFGYVHPTHEVLLLFQTHFKRDAPIVEVGAGNGYWAAVMRSHGFEAMRCTDDGTWPDPWSYVWHQAEIASATQILQAQSPRIVLVVYPTPIVGEEVARSLTAGDRLL
jgi:hypothetical protein